MHLAAGRDERRLGVVGVDEHVGAVERRADARDAVVSCEDREALARQDERGGAVDGEERVEDRGALVRVGGPDHVEAGDRPQRAELVDGLVRRAVLAERPPSRG